MGNNRPWVYKVTVPAGKSQDFIWALGELDLIDDDALEVLEEGS